MQTSNNENRQKSKGRIAKGCNGWMHIGSFDKAHPVATAMWTDRLIPEPWWWLALDKDEDKDENGEASEKGENGISNPFKVALDTKP